jgi:hypothetical protein
VIFGVTAYGGVSGYDGTAFEMVKANGVYTYRVIYNFTAAGGDGLHPYGSVVLLKGKLFGTTELGGSFGDICMGSGCGMVFELTEKNQVWTETVLHDFVGSDGNGPLSGLIADPSGHLFGVTYSGGNGCSAPGCGVVFEIIP